MEILACLGILVVIALVVSIQPLIVMLLWNWLVPAIFHGPTIGFWQSLGLCVLMGLLTGLGKIQFSSKD